MAMALGLVVVVVAIPDSFDCRHFSQASLDSIEHTTVTTP
jgi:hypothetical protein